MEFIPRKENKVGTDQEKTAVSIVAKQKRTGHIVNPNQYTQTRVYHPCAVFSTCYRAPDHVLWSRVLAQCIPASSGMFSVDCGT